MTVEVIQGHQKPRGSVEKICSYWRSIVTMTLCCTIFEILL